MEIKSSSKLFDVLNAYPALEEKIIHIAPLFKNLQNPALRRTVGKLATMEKVAQIGNLEVIDLVNILRRETGQPEISPDSNPRFAVLEKDEKDPEWITGEPQFVVNGSEILESGEVPLQEVDELLKKLNEGRFILLLTDFEPAPIMDALQRKDRVVYHKNHPGNEDQHLTYIK
ncbi:MAG: DUF1858 domain-containing protein [Anaerolineaceae bacterium]|nr:DUF1858 domain-containing protein [Anaerolineaceae bacterium]